MFKNVEEILKANFLKILKSTILRKFGARFYSNFGNNLNEKKFKNYKEIYMYPEILKKIFLHCGNSLRK